MGFASHVNNYQKIVLVVIISSCSSLGDLASNDTIHLQALYLLEDNSLD